MARKTVNVAFLLETVNKSLATSTCSEDVRQGMCMLLEEALHNTGNYNGFLYLMDRDVPAGELPGVREGDTTEERFVNVDDTRRKYFGGK